MVLIPLQSETMKKYKYLEGYLDVAPCHDVRQAASSLVRKTIAFAKLCYFEEKNLAHKFSYKNMSLLWKENWPKTGEFTLFSAFPKIEAFMNQKYGWLQGWPHSTRHLKEIKSGYVSFHVYEICYGPARVSYPVSQTTFSVYFIFEVNHLAEPNSECAVKYFLEGNDEILIPHVRDKITLPQIKSLMKKKLALSALIMLGSQPVQEANWFDDNLRRLIQKKKEMLREIRFECNVEAKPFPFALPIRVKNKCDLHGKECPVLHHNVSPSGTPMELTYEDFMRSQRPNLWKRATDEILERLPAFSPSSESTDSSGISEKPVRKSSSSSGESKFEVKLRSARGSMDNKSYALPPEENL